MSKQTHKSEGVNRVQTMRFFPLVFTGKEKDSETGYGYFGARYMDHELMTMWLSVDPLADKYPNISPYAYCAWNPLKLVDPDGCEINPVYDLSGNFLGNTKEGFTGEPIISTEEALNKCKEVYGVSKISDLSASQVLEGFGETFDNLEKKGGLSQQAQENIFTDIVSKMEGTSVDGHTFSMNDIGGKIRYYAKSSNNRSNIGTNTHTHTIYANHQYDWYETTVENFQASIIYHEWYGHIVNGWGNGNQYATRSNNGTHYKCYESVIGSPIFCKTTKAYQDFNNDMKKRLSK